MDELNRQQADPEDDEEFLDESEPIADDDDLDDEPFNDELALAGEEDLEEEPDEGELADGDAVPAAERLTGLVHYVASKLVADPSAIELTAEQRGGTVYVGLRVPESDLGRVIGRGGRTAQAMRTLVSIAGSKNHLHARLDIDG